MIYILKVDFVTQNLLKEWLLYYDFINYFIIKTIAFYNEVFSGNK